MSIATLPSPQAQRLLDARGPFVSVYFDDSHDAPDAAEQLEVKWRDIQRELLAQNATPGLISMLERAITESRPAVGRGGRGLIAVAEGVLIDERLVVAPTTPVARVSALPYIAPLVRYGSFPEACILLAVDHVGADLTLRRGDSVRTETIDPGGYPVHKVAASDIHGWGDSQHRVEEAVRKNVRAVAEQLTDACDRHPAEIVFVIGQDRVRAELLAAVPERVRARVVQPGVGARPTGMDETVRRAITAELQKSWLGATTEVAERFRAEVGRGSGLAVSGIAPVCAALREDAVATLIIGDALDQTVLAGDDPTIIAPDADTLSTFGVAPSRTLRADEAIPFAAMACGAELVRADESLRVPDGFAALLRFVPPKC